jgi:cobalt-precorrin-5B (C1)-methyltransferase
LGARDLHSSRSTLDTAALAALAAEAGMSGAEQVLIAEAASGGEALARLDSSAAALARAVAVRARQQALVDLEGGIDVEVVVYDRCGRELAAADGF